MRKSEKKAIRVMRVKLGGYAKKERNDVVKDLIWEAEKALTNLILEVERDD